MQSRQNEHRVVRKTMTNELKSRLSLSDRSVTLYKHQLMPNQLERDKIERIRC